MIYFPTIWGAKDPRNLPNHRVVRNACVFFGGAMSSEEDLLLLYFFFVF